MNSRSTPPRPRAAYWWCQIGGWSVLFIVNILTTQAFTAMTSRVVGSFVWLTFCGIVITHALRGIILRRRWAELPVTKLLPRMIAANIVLAVVLVAAVWLYFLVLPQPTLASLRNSGGTMLSLNFVFFFNDFIILTLWSCIYFGVASFERQRRMEIAHYEAKTALSEAELRGLKSQLNPHFFFNSLNSLRALVTEDPVRAQEAITHLADILRYHLQSGEHSLVPLHEEIVTAEQYLALELIRFEDRLVVERSFDERASSFLVPPLALQTLVENAVKYGVSRDDGSGVIKLSAALADERLAISVRNTGSLEDVAAGQSTGVGLANLRTRLRLLFADKASLQLREPEAGWVEALIILPATQTLESDRT